MSPANLQLESRKSGYSDRYWQRYEIQYVSENFAVRYPEVSKSQIRAAMKTAKSLVSPVEGRLKLYDQLKRLLGR